MARAAAAAVLAFACGPAAALVFISEASVTDADFNTTAPTGVFAGSGWQWVGAMGGITGAPIGPRHFLAARHIGGSVGSQFVFNGTAYTTTASFDDPASDLRLWQIDGTFPASAPLYRAATEEGRPLVVFGRGNVRGAEVRVNGTGALRGWQWASGDGRLRWGANRVETYANLEKVYGGNVNRTLLYANFNNGTDADANIRTNEVHTAGGDSSGPVFIDDGTGWKLAGVVYAVTCCFSTTAGGATFNASIFDMRGLYLSGTLVSWSTALPGLFVATRVSQRLAWVDAILARLPQTIAFPAIAGRGIADSPFTPPASASSGLPVALSVVSGPATASGAVVTLTGIGRVTLRAEQAGDGTYLPATPVLQAFDVLQSTQTITFGAIGTQTLGGAPVQLSATASSGLPVSFASLTPSTCSVAGTSVNLVALGTCTVEAGQAGNTSYSPANPVARSFQIVSQGGGGPSATVPLPGWMPALLALALCGIAWRRL